MSNIMKLKVGNASTFEIHLLNPGESFPGFGGSKRGIVVEKTPSWIIREYNHESGSMFDAEYGVESGWERIRNLISKATEIKSED